MARLSGKSAIVTGGASGIGKAIAQLFLEEGARVVIADINKGLLETTTKELAAAGTVSSIMADVRSMADAGRIVQHAVDRIALARVGDCDPLAARAHQRAGIAWLTAA